ncbi:MAG: VCBS repeat-containing protein [Planctomycetota bacterium]
MFRRRTFQPNPASPSPRALGDVDADGDLDLVLGKARVGTRSNRLYLNNGNGVFTDVSATHLPADTDDTTAVVCEDLDGDGDLDLFLANDRQQDRLYLGNGAGRFADATATHLPLDTRQTVGAVGRDLDGDGDVDLVLADPLQSRIFWNAGDGRFTEAPGSLPAGARSTGVVFGGDFDLDADVDVFLGTDVLGGGQRLYFNRQRQLEAPLLARSGSEYTLRAFARRAVAPTPDLAVPVLSAGTGRLPLPWGVLGLDPTQLVALPPFAILPASGTGTGMFVVPAQPSLLGASFYTQALLVGRGQARLTNVAADTVFR